jgi:hypothetical protein
LIFEPAFSSIAPSTPLKLGIAKRYILLLARLLDLLSCSLVRVPLLQPPHILVQIWVVRIAQRYALAGSLEPKVNHNVCCGQAGTAEELSFGGRFHKVVFQEIKVILQLWVHKRAVDFGGDATSDGLEEEGDWGVLDAWMMVSRVSGKRRILRWHLLPVTMARIRTVKRLPSV